MDPDYLPFHPNPSKPSIRLPAGAVDAHCHVFGPADKFPYSPKRKYTPCDAPKEKLFALRDFLGFERNVIVQGSCHGQDNRALLDALAAAGDLARGVVVIDEKVTDAELENMHHAGVRGVRFNFVKRLADPKPHAYYLSIAERIAKLGWHIVVYFEAADLEDLIPFLEKLPTDVVIDHMGRPDIRQGIEGKGFARFVEMMAANERFWTKVSCPERLSLSGPPYDDVAPFASKLIESFPERVLWGTDWPHPNMKSHVPDDGQLVDIIEIIAPTETLKQVLLVTNPMRLYWTESAS
ncbi:2-pyrone-4,6-dicarboxylic acid hydrolase [hydrothermal vent metagenome]|uniref:2-pyrone-4,6-dicarboxylic acid hydrolase n=1 Tax=hydrothermal vent metagenome TaxID=652676 RepID=A0A3B0RWL0_9ZZZZ